MSTQEVMNLVFSFLGGGLVAGLLEWVRSTRAEARARRAVILSDQLNHLYGPLYFFTSQNAALFELSRSFHAAYSAVYVDQKFSDDPHTQASLDKDTLQTLSLANQYIETVKNNNERISELLISAYSYIDPGDAEVFRQFFIDHVRLRTEFDRDGKLLTPRMIYNRIGDISFMRPSFMERIQKQFEAKKGELAKYSN
ncbi:MAG: hypothetical protein LAN62_03770 [Acidobacteriia bacterium]|nr:hypothetical protein [Terriglobia bacterium]